MKQGQIPQRWLLALLVPVALLLGACAENFPLPVRGNESILTRPVQRDVFPGVLLLTIRGLDKAKRTMKTLTKRSHTLVTSMNIAHG